MKRYTLGTSQWWPKEKEDSKEGMRIKADKHTIGVCQLLSHV